MACVDTQALMKYLDNVLGEDIPSPQKILVAPLIYELREGL